MKRLITTTNMPIKMIKLEKKKYLNGEMSGYQFREPNGWKILMKKSAKIAVKNINRMILLFS
jgi:hypothetical protein